MNARECIDPSLDRADVTLDVFAARQTDDGLRQRQCVLGAVVNFAGQQVLTFFGLFAFGNVYGHAADTDDTPFLVDARRRRAGAPAYLAVRPNDSKLRFVGRDAFGELGHRLAQFVNVVRVEQFLNACRCHRKCLRIDAENLILALVPHPVAIDPVPVPGSHLSGGDRKAPALLALQQPRVGFLQFSGSGAYSVLEFGVEPFQLAGLAIELGEHLDLGAQHFRHHRHRNVVDRAHLIAAQPVDVADLNRRDEYHRRFLEARMFADHRGKFESVEFRHANVDQDDGDVVLEQELERFAPRRGRDQVFSEVLQNDFIGEQLGRLIVHQKNIDFLLVHHLPAQISGEATYGWRGATARC